MSRLETVGSAQRPLTLLIIFVDKKQIKNVRKVLLSVFNYPQRAERPLPPPRLQVAVVNDPPANKASDAAVAVKAAGSSVFFSKLH